jgi:hypothetical protein
MVVGLLILSTLACQKASELVNQVGVELEQEFGEGSGWEDAFPEDGPEGLSSFCKSMLPMGIFAHEPDAQGRIYPDDAQFMGGSWVQCVFEWDGDGVWCEWGYINHEEEVSDCWTTPDPDRNRPEPERCNAYDRVSGAFCGEQTGESITGITNVTKVELRYEQDQNSGPFRHVEKSHQQGGVMSCNVKSDDTCVGTWSTGELYGDWVIGMP